MERNISMRHNSNTRVTNVLTLICNHIKFCLLKSTKFSPTFNSVFPFYAFLVSSRVQIPIMQSSLLCSVYLVLFTMQSLCLFLHPFSITFTLFPTFLSSLSVFQYISLPIFKPFSSFPIPLPFILFPPCLCPGRLQYDIFLPLFFQSHSIHSQAVFSSVLSSIACGVTGRLQLHSSKQFAYLRWIFEYLKSLIKTIFDHNYILYLIFYILIFCVYR